MSFVVEKFLKCNGEGGECEEAYGWDDRGGPSRTRRELRYDAKDEMDWTSAGNKDYCEKCKKKF